MAIRFYISGYLATFAGGHSQVDLSCPAPAVRQALDALWEMHPGLRDRILNERGQVRPHVNVFLGNDNIRDLDGLETAVTDGAEVCILPAVSGGADDSRPFGERKKNE